MWTTLHVAVPDDDDGLPPTGGQLVPGNHQVTDVDIIPGRGQAWRRCRVVAGRGCVAHGAARPEPNAT